MALRSDGDATTKRLRLPVDDEPNQHNAAPAAAAAAPDHLSALPEVLQLRILSFLPLKSAIVTSSLSSSWRHRWKGRWQDDGNPSWLYHHLRPYSSPSSKKLLDSLELRRSQGRGRLDRYTLVVDTPAMTARRFSRYLESAAGCGVEDLRVELRSPPSPATLRFPFSAAPASPALACLTLHGIEVSGLNSRAARPCSALEVVRLHSVRINDGGLARMLALCPRLRVLGLHSCDDLRRITVTAALGMRMNLRSVTIAGCSRVVEVDVAAVSSLQSFRYSGGFLSSFYLPGGACLTDLCIRFGVQRSGNVLICKKVFSEWFESHVCSKLTTLTICSNVLFVVSSLPIAILHAESVKMDDFFKNMTELQLLMLEMRAPDLANIYMFLKNSQCCNLERLFVQLPSIPSELLVDPFDYVLVEPTENGLENLKVVKIVNFNWNHIELQLVCFLLRKATSLDKMILVTPTLVPSNAPGIQKADLLFLAEAGANGKVILRESDDAVAQPFHSDVFADF